MLFEDDLAVTVNVTGSSLFLFVPKNWSIILLHVSAFSIVFSFLLSLIGLDDTHCPIELGPRMRRHNI